MDASVTFPKNAVEWQMYVSSLQQKRKANITNQQVFNPKQGTVTAETRPVAPAASSENWSNAMWKGYQTSDDLSTYIIPRHEQKKLALFSRYILKDQNDTHNDYLKKAQERFAQKAPYQSVKKYVNTKKLDFGGQTVMNPQSVLEAGVDLETDTFVPESMKNMAAKLKDELEYREWNDTWSDDELQKNDGLPLDDMLAREFSNLSL